MLEKAYVLQFYKMQRNWNIRKLSLGSYQNGQNDQFVIFLGYFTDIKQYIFGDSNDFS